MAIVNKKSTGIANATAMPPVRSNRVLISGPMQGAVGTVTKEASDSNGSVYAFARIPSNARIDSIRLENDVIAEGTSYSCGVYAADGSVVNATLFRGVLDLTTARSVPTEIKAIGAANAEKLLWQLIGETTDTGLMYDVCLTATIAGTGAGNIALYVNYTT